MCGRDWSSDVCSSDLLSPSLSLHPSTLHLSTLQPSTLPPSPSTHPLSPRVPLPACLCPRASAHVPLPACLSLLASPRVPLPACTRGITIGFVNDLDYSQTGRFTIGNEILIAFLKCITSLIGTLIAEAHTVCQLDKSIFRQHFCEDVDGIIFSSTVY